MPNVRERERKERQYLLAHSRHCRLCSMALSAAEVVKRGDRINASNLALGPSRADSLDSAVMKQQQNSSTYLLHYRNSVEASPQCRRKKQARWDEKTLGGAKHLSRDGRWVVTPTRRQEVSVPKNGKPALRREIRGTSRDPEPLDERKVGWGIPGQASFIPGLSSAGSPDCHVDWSAPPIGNVGVGTV